jgi:CDP-paratose 2-epimerase
MKTILITGDLGLTGRACADLFSAQGWAIIGVDNNQRSRFFGTTEQKDASWTHYSFDLRDEVRVQHLFEAHRFDAIIHAAAQPSHDYATHHALEDFDVNARATLILLEAARTHCPESPFIFVSTDKVYGENMDTVLHEGSTRFTPVSPLLAHGFDESLGLDFAGDRSLFGCSKAAADMYAQEYAARFDMPIGIFRPGCITGKNHQGAEQHGFLSYLAKSIKGKRTYKIFGHGGKQVRDQIHADDVASAFLHFIGAPRTGEVYNLGGGLERSLSVLEAMEQLSASIGETVSFEHSPPREGDRRWDVHNVAKFRTHYPAWEYRYDLAAIIKDVS